MSATAYRLLGYAVWRGAKWYVGKRLPSRRSLALSGAAAIGAVGVTVALGRRLAG
jgi:hypothetical protein